MSFYEVLDEVKHAIVQATGLDTDTHCITVVKRKPNTHWYWVEIATQPVIDAMHTGVVYKAYMRIIIDDDGTFYIRLVTEDIIFDPADFNQVCGKFYTAADMNYFKWIKFEIQMQVSITELEIMHNASN